MRKNRVLLAGVFGAVLLVAALLLSATSSNAQSGAPAIVSYQGRVTVDGQPYTGSGHFKFAVVSQAGNVTYWSNDGTSVAGSEPTNAVLLPVASGLFNGLLGDTSLGGMTQPLNASVFDGTDRYLRVWFSDDGLSFTRLTPDWHIAAVP